MIKAIVFDFSGVIFFHKDENYTGSHNKLHEELVNKTDYKVFDYFRLNEELLNFLKTLKGKYRLFIFSAGRIQDRLEVKEALNQIFDRIFSVDEIGFPKNNEQSYIEISKKMNTSPADIIFIDDTIENVDSAKKAGLNVIRFSNNENLMSKLSEIQL